MKGALTDVIAAVNSRSFTLLSLKVNKTKIIRGLKQQETGYHSNVGMGGGGVFYSDIVLFIDLFRCDITSSGVPVFKCGPSSMCS